MRVYIQLGEFMGWAHEQCTLVTSVHVQRSSFSFFPFFGETLVRRSPDLPDLLLRPCPSSCQLTVLHSLPVVSLPFCCLSLVWREEHGEPTWNLREHGGEEKTVSLEDKLLTIWKEVKESSKETVTSDVAQRKKALERLVDPQNLRTVFQRDNSTCRKTKNSQIAENVSRSDLSRKSFVRHDSQLMWPELCCCTSLTRPLSTVSRQPRLIVWLHLKLRPLISWVVPAPSARLRTAAAWLCCIVV